MLEFGSGTGNYVPIVRQLGLEYVGVDVTEAMVEKARQKFPDTRFEIDDIFQSRQHDGSYDVFVSADVLVHLPQFEQPFATLYRIARRHVVLKLCYLTRNKGLKRYLQAAPPSFMRRTSQGFIEHFFNLKQIKRTIEARHHPTRIRVVTFRSNHKTSPYQAILVISKAGAY